ncbi:MAG: hypothetical protein QXJ23_10610 [Thermofilum sp.]|uniref:hypothetical protein n=1 Tax=Thermofilum sp. TaxID=1961369 RepID=UPI003176D9F6
MVNELEILTNIRNDIREYLGTAKISEISNTLKSINSTLERLELLLSKLQLVQVPSSPPTPTIPPSQPTPPETYPISPMVSPAPPFVYMTKIVSTPITISPLQTFNIFNEIDTSGVLYEIWIIIQNSNAFKLILNIDGADFSITPDQLISFTTGTFYTNNEWEFTYINTPPGPPFALRFQSIEGLPFKNSINFSVQNISNNENIIISQYKYIYKKYV